MQDKAIQLIELKAQYRLLGEVEELWLCQSSSKFFKAHSKTILKDYAIQLN
jgi:hypothetical protein